MSAAFSLADVKYIKRVILGNEKPETAPDEDKYESQLQYLNR